MITKKEFPVAKVQLVPKLTRAELNIDKTKHIGVIGGAGKMGTYFLKICKNLGYSNLHIADPNAQAAKKLAGEHGLIQEQNADLAKHCDITIVSVPIAKTIGVVNEVGPAVKPGSLFAHFTSIQSPALNEMKKYAQCEIMGIHIMAAPSNDLTLENVNIALVSEQEGPWFNFMRQFLSETGANMIKVGAADHDLLTAIVQANVHLNMFLFGYVLRKVRKQFGIELKDIEMLQTPLFQFIKFNMGRICFSKNPDLYADIQMENPQVENILTLLKDGVTKFQDIIQKKDRGGFNGMFDRMLNYFGPYRSAWTKKESDEFVKKFEPSYKQHVTKFQDEIKSYYEKEFTQIAEKSGCLNKPCRKEIKKVGEAFGYIGYYLKENDFEKAAEMAKIMIRQIKRAEGSLAGDEQLQKATSGLITMFEDLNAMQKEVI